MHAETGDGADGPATRLAQLLVQADTACSLGLLHDLRRLHASPDFPGFVANPVVAINHSQVVVLTGEFSSESTRFVVGQRCVRSNLCNVASCCSARAPRHTPPLPRP
jgi:hypothetical protein